MFCFLYIHAEVFGFRLKEHPRIFITKAQLPMLAKNSRGPLIKEYLQIKLQADGVVEQGLVKVTNRFSPPIGLVCCAISYLVERELGNESDKYALAIKKYWSDGKILNIDGDGFFGFHGILYDWIFDALSEQERIVYGDQLGKWLRFYTDTPEITLRNGHWLYNQTWGPAHLNTPNTRDGITPKLFVALALKDAGTVHDADAGKYLDSWRNKVISECIPAFNEMGGVWSESMGHGGYGPLVVIPWAFESWRTATGEDLFKKSAKESFLPEMTAWAVHTTVPFANHTAWIDDNIASQPSAFARVAPLLASRYKNKVAQKFSDDGALNGWSRIPWERFIFYNPKIKSSTPKERAYELAYHFKGAGHVYMREKWDDPNSTWAFFGAGPYLAGHSRDDEGHFMISKKGYLVLRAGGSGHNDSDYYTGGSLAFNIVTIFDENEKFRRTNPNQENGVKNENDGGMMRYLYSSHDRIERADIKSYHHNKNFTYAAADLTKAYSPHKINEVTRQFLYLRGVREFFVVFDRVESINPDYPKHWFLHIPDNPEVDGPVTTLIDGHVYKYKGNFATWFSDPAGERNILSTGRAKAFLTVLLPRDPVIAKRGGEGHDLWGHPLEPTAQYNHVPLKNRRNLPHVPWRLEIEAPVGTNKSYFLNVIEIGDETDNFSTPVELTDQDKYFTVRINLPDTPVELFFSKGGELDLGIKFGHKKPRYFN